MWNVRQEYVHSMMESDYILCARGAGNFSRRLYEALSCGRIPVFVDTDCVLPYQSEINWKEYFVCGLRVGEKVAEFHGLLSA